MTKRKPLHIGLSLAPTWLSGDAWRRPGSNIEGLYSSDFALDLARRAEAAHLDFVFRPDVSFLPMEGLEAGAGFASPKQADPPAAEPAPGGPPDPELAARIKERFGERCRYERACGELVGVDCDAAADGPYYYVTRADLKTVSTCGGACMGGRCTDCPPKAWTCPTY